jgi:hypothetical protein
MRTSITKFATIVVGVGALLSISASVAHAAAKPNVGKGEGNWGIDGPPLVDVVGVTSGSGELFNISDHELKHVVIVVGEVKNNTEIIFGNASLQAPLKPDDDWFWNVPPKDRGYQVLRVYVDDQELQPLTP